MNRCNGVKARHDIHRRITMIKDNLNDGKYKTSAMKRDARKRLSKLRDRLRSINRNVNH